MKANILLTVAGVLVGLVICEIGLRVAGITYPSFYQYDVDLGASLRPGAEGWSKGEGEAFIQINNAGWRDREHSYANTGHTFRVAVLGDSYAEAMAVPMEEAFWSVLERELKGCPALSGREPEVLSFGVSGYGTAQELLTLRHRVWPYAPDVVILAFLSGNDVRNNSRQLEQDEMKPYFVRINEELVPDLTFRDTTAFRFAQTRVAQWKGQILNALRLYQVFTHARSIVKAGWAQLHHSSLDVKSVSAAEKSDSGLSVVSSDLYAEAGLDAMIYLEPRDSAWREAWDVTERLILQMRNEVKEKGAHFMVATLSNSIQVLPDPKVRRVIEQQLGVPNLFYPDIRIRELGERADIAVLNLAPSFQTYADEHKVYLHGFQNSGIGKGHWNEKGHRLAGSMIAQKLCGELLGKVPSRL